MRRHCDHNRLHWEGHCDQQVSLVTRRSSTVVAVSKMCVASWSGYLVVTSKCRAALRSSQRMTYFGIQAVTRPASESSPARRVSFPGWPSVKAVYPGSFPGWPSVKAVCPGSFPGWPSVKAVYPDSFAGWPSVKAVYTGFTRKLSPVYTAPCSFFVL